ncbi:MAM and LDL-receptor class A domain-containing protein 1-like [Branchiostoma floridae x Branchiostoma belcheri]
MGRVGVVRMIVLLFVSTVSGTADPCQNHGIINQARRSSAAETDDPDLDICDIYLDRGWYRFTSYTGGEIPTSCVQPYRCSTQVPVWMNGTLPEGDDIVNRTACGNLGVPTDCCSIPMDIRVKRCTESGGVFYVYELEPTYFCPMAYCAGSLPLCPDGEVYDDFHKHCIETRPIVPCDFEGHGFCEWLQERDDELNWTKTCGQQSSGSVLPGVDHTIGTATGSYAFIRSSASNQPGDMARLISPIIVPSKTGTCNINFYYQVEGPETGTLRIYKKGYHSSRKSLVWTSPHNRVSVWTAAVVSLIHANPFQVIIEGTLGSDGQSAIAFDDVSFSSGCYIEVDGAVRLVDGTRFGEGRVEIFYDHEWGTICNRSSWTQTNGDVICSQLGYTSSVPSSRHYPAPSSTPIHLDEVWCSSGNVTKISSCSHSRWGHYHPDCDHLKDVSVACTGQWYRCRETEFTCSNTICVPPEVQCDFTNDCGDNSDEQDCGQFPGRCDFQDGLCSWVQATSDSADWVHTDGGSETTPGAPPTDHRTRTGGTYLLLASASAETRNAVLTLSEYYFSTADDCKIFFHYFKTTSSGQLSLRLSTRRSRSAGMTVTSSSGRHWVREELVVPVNTTFQVSFEGIVEPSSGVIAIDDISLTPGCVRVQVDDPKTKDNPQTVSQKSGLPVSATVAITVVCSVFLLGLAGAAAALCYLRRKNKYVKCIENRYYIRKNV